MKQLTWIAVTLCFLALFVLSIGTSLKNRDETNQLREELARTRQRATSAENRLSVCHEESDWWSQRWIDEVDNVSEVSRVAANYSDRLVACQESWREFWSEPRLRVFCDRSWSSDWHPERNGAR